MFTREQQRFVELNIAELHTIGRELTDVQRQRFLQLQQHIVSLETQLRVSFHLPFTLSVRLLHLFPTLPKW